MLPQLTVKFYFSAKATLDSIDNTVVNNPNKDKSDSQRWYCYCLSEEFGEMIACDFIMCSIEWFHIKYLHLSKISKREWYCPYYQNLRDKNKGLYMK